MAALFKGAIGKDTVSRVWRRVNLLGSQVVAQIGVPTSFDIRRSDWVRLCFCDAPDSGYSYSPCFLRQFEETYCYDRFFDYDTKDAYKSTRYVMCSYAFIMVGSCLVSTRPISVEGGLRPLLPLLAIGETCHAGSHASLGLGRYRMHLPG